MSQFRSAHRLHEIHGSDVMLYRNSSTARRIEEKDNGLVFSAHSIKPNEKFAVKLTEVSDKSTGIITVGFTSHDPSTLRQSLPKNATKKLKRDPFFWLCSLSKHRCVINTVIFFYVDSTGNIRYGVGNDEKGLFEKKVDTKRALWAVIDIWNSPTTIQVVSSKLSMKRFAPWPPNLLATLKYKFTSKPIACDEKVSVKILDEVRLSLGITSCDPSHLDLDKLPQAVDLLLDRAEYWVVIDDPTWKFQHNDEIDYVINSAGQMKIWKNKSLLLKVVHVDRSLQLWGFFKVENVHRIQVTTSLSPNADSTLHKCQDLRKSTSPKPSSSDQSECVICCENLVEAALYPCGHMCVCYECARKQWLGKKGEHCPLCRAEIKDFLKIYKS